MFFGLNWFYDRFLSYHKEFIFRQIIRLRWWINGFKCPVEIKIFFWKFWGGLRGAVNSLNLAYLYLTLKYPLYGATDCPCDVWCRGLTTCLLHVGPPFGNRFFNTSWAVGLTYWIVYLHFFCILTYAIIYVLIHHIIFWLYLHFLNILNFFKYSCTNIFHKHSLCTF